VLIYHVQYDIWSRIPGPSSFDRKNNESFQLGNVFRVIYYEFAGPSCLASNYNYSIKHVLIDCIDDADVRQNFYNVNNLCNLFANVAGETILKVLKDIDLNAQI
jgi:hypothetical protein